MAERPVYISKTSYPYFEEIRVQFDWFPGFALSQKRKSEISLHHNFLNAFPNEKILEISSASTSELGCALSAMHLSKRVKLGDGENSKEIITSVETAFQCSRVYMDGDTQIGPFPQLLNLTGKEAKKIVKEYSKGLHSFLYSYQNKTFYAPDFHISLFYDYLYMNALLEPENDIARNKLLQESYSAFTDLATKALNSQARSCAIFVGLHRAGLLNEITSHSTYMKLFRVGKDGNAIGKESYENVQLLDKKGNYQLKKPVVLCTFDKEKTINYYNKG
ncbi:MAG: DUF6977 family protein [Lachnospiraceae bacterium]